MPSFVPPLNGHTDDNDLGPIPPAHDGMEIDRHSPPSPISAAPSRLQIIMEGLTEVIRETLGPNHHTSTSDINAPIDHGLLRGVLIELPAQDIKLPDDVGVVISAIPVVERIVELAASISEESKGGNVIAGALVPIYGKSSTIRHPHVWGISTGTLPLMGRTIVTYPNFGKAGSAYARSVTPKTVLPSVLPDPSAIFDGTAAPLTKGRLECWANSKQLCLLEKDLQRSIPNVFRTNEHDYNQVDSSSYLDLGPLHGHNEQQKVGVRTFIDGKLKPGAISDARVLGFPPGVCALLVSFNRFHNFVVEELAFIGEGGRFSLPVASAQNASYEAAIKHRDNDLFRTGRLITCGLYVHIILGDYLKTILNLNRCNSTWNLDPLADLGLQRSPPPLETKSVSSSTSDTDEAFRLLERYAHEGYRLNPPMPRLTRIIESDTTIRDGERLVRVRTDDQILVDLATACLDPNHFSNPRPVDLNRPVDQYIHHGWGPHACIGRPISVTAMAAQLRVFAQLKNLRRAPGEAGKLKSKTGWTVKVFMKEDGSD